MNLFNINISFSYWKFIILGCIALFFFGLIVWIICSDCKAVLKEYGNFPIKRIYLVRQPITKFVKILLNIVTLYKFEQEMKKYIKTTNNDVFFPQHTSIIIEIELPNKTRKQILIEKNNCIKLALDFRISNKQDMCKISIGKNKYTLNNLLEKTRERVGNNMFFNWSICRNNCQMLTKEILITLKKFTKKNENFMFQSEFANQIKFSEFSLHIINTIINLCNTFETFIGRTLYF